jgi:serine/threonine protein kinase
MEVGFSDLILGNRIGQGACSSVNVARHRRTGELYAIKMFNVYDKGQASQLYNEILLLTSFKCDCLITLKGAFHDEGSIGVIIEYMDKGSLEFISEPHIAINDQAMAAITFQICWGLGYLHHEKQIHRDVKPGNILMVTLDSADYPLDFCCFSYCRFTCRIAEFPRNGEAFRFWDFKRAG